MGVSLFCNMSWNLANRSNDSVGQEHYDAIRSDSNSENWAFFAYDYPTKTQVTCTGSGSGDINEFFDHVKGQMVDTDFAELKLVMRKADVLNFSLPLGSQNLDQTNSQLWLKET